MYVGVSNGQSKSSQTTGMRTRSSPSLLLKHPTKRPELLSYGVFTSEGYREAREAESSGVTKQLPENPSTQSLSKGKSSHRLLISQRKPLLCPSEKREWRGRGEKKNALGESWGSDKGLKGGLRSSFGVPLVCRERFPLGLGLGLSASAWEPELPQLRDGDPSESPVSSTVPE